MESKTDSETIEVEVELLDNGKILTIHELEKDALSTDFVDIQIRINESQLIGLKIIAHEHSSCEIQLPPEYLKNLTTLSLTNVFFEVANIVAIISIAADLEILVLNAVGIFRREENMFPWDCVPSELQKSIRELFITIGAAKRLTNVDLSNNSGIFTIPYESPTKLRKNSKEAKQYNADLPRYHDARNKYVEELCVALLKPSRVYELNHCNLGELFLFKIGNLSDNSMFVHGGSLEIFLHNNSFLFHEVWHLMQQIKDSKISVTFDKSIMEDETALSIFNRVTESYSGGISFD